MRLRQDRITAWRYLVMMLRHRFLYPLNDSVESSISKKDQSPDSSDIRDSMLHYLCYAPCARPQPMSSDKPIQAVILQITSLIRTRLWVLLTESTKSTRRILVAPGRKGVVGPGRHGHV